MTVCTLEAANAQTGIETRSLLMGAGRHRLEAANAQTGIETHPLPVVNVD